MPLTVYLFDLLGEQEKGKERKGIMTRKECTRKDSELRLEKQKLMLEEALNGAEQQRVNVEMLQNQIAYSESNDSVSPKG